MARSADEIVRLVLAGRGIAEDNGQDSFLSPDYGSLHDPFLLPDMDVAIKRLAQARDSDEIVGIFGDYDIDGVTATTVLVDLFDSFGVEHREHIPNRFIEGYGMSNEGVDALAAEGVGLIVTVDCGSTSHSEIEYAASKGIDVIVTDHHEVPEKLPPALAVINPKRADSKYPFRELAGVGVAFKLATALQQKHEAIEVGQEKWLLDVVAFGTVCDVVPLVDENRTLVYWGLRVAQKSRRPGFRALAEVTETAAAEVDSQRFGFVYGPRLNAAGRLETAQHSLDLLLARSYATAVNQARLLDEMNTNRRKEQSKIFAEAIRQAEKYDSDPVLVLSGKGWAQGVVGIVASKLVEKFGKPSFVLSELDDGTTKGSARSFGDFSVVDAIRANQDHLIVGGGHAHAGGLTLNTSNIKLVRKGFNEHYRAQNLADQAQYLLPTPDLTLEVVEEASLDLIAGLQKLEPFGMKNPQPLFKLTASVADSRAVGADKSHLKLTLSDNSGRIDGIAFGQAEKMPAPGEEITVIASVDKNEFRGNTTPQLMIKTIL
jgi:single-stranded-DNA-specific exonuclease